MSIRQVWWLTCYSAWNVFFFFISTISFTVASRTNNCLYESVPVFVTRMVSLLKDKSLGELWSYIFCVLRMCASVAVWWISLVKLWLYVCLPGTWSECRCATCYYCVMVCRFLCWCVCKAYKPVVIRWQDNRCANNTHTRTRTLQKLSVS